MARGDAAPAAALQAVQPPECPAIDLAAIPAFALGPLRIDPPLREVAGPHGRESLEPRVMMVLVALAEADGRTVSRDMLIARCWGGLAVSDDAINRVIGRLRKLAETSGAFAIETVTRVGYRLTPAAAAAAPPGPRQEAGAAPGVPRRLLLAGGLGATVLAGAGAVLLARRRPPAERPATVALVDSGREALLEHEPARQRQGVAMLREAVLADPQSPLGWGALALGNVMIRLRTPHAQQPALVRETEAAIARALALDPVQPEALAARAALVQLFGNWAAYEAALTAAEARPSPLWQHRSSRARFLNQVGRSGAALAAADADLAANPAALYPRVTRAIAASALGRTLEADRDTADTVRLFPGNYLGFFHRFYFLAYAGRLDEARRLLEDPLARPRAIPEAELAQSGRLLEALAAPAGPAADAHIAEYEALVPQGRGYMENAVRVAAALGRADHAFRWAEGHLLAPIERLPDRRFANQDNYGPAAERLTDHLFYPPVTRLHADPRFLVLMEKTGLATYWRTVGKGPDFCPNLPACRAACIPAPA